MKKYLKINNITPFELEKIVACIDYHITTFELRKVKLESIRREYAEEMEYYNLQQSIYFYENIINKLKRCVKLKGVLNE